MMNQDTPQHARDTSGQELSEHLFVMELEQAYPFGLPLFFPTPESNAGCSNLQNCASHDTGCTNVSSCPH